MSETKAQAVGDMKAGLTSARPKLSILPRTGLIYGVRAIEYGAAKYARGNYHGAPPAGVSEAQRLLGYVDAAMRHLTKTADALNRALGTGGDLAAAAATRDMDASGGFPASQLPDLSHALASLLIGVSCAVDGGLLPDDPGQPWTATTPEVGLPQKDDPAGERARVARAGERRAQTAYDLRGRQPAAYEAFRGADIPDGEALRLALLTPDGSFAEFVTSEIDAYHADAADAGKIGY